MILLLGVALAIPRDRCDAQQRAPRGPALSGTIVSSHGEPVGFVFITDERGRRRAIADESGQFTIPAWRGNDVAFTFRRIGYHPTRVTRSFPADTVIELEVVMVPLVPVLDEVVVRAVSTSPALSRTGFYERLEHRLRGPGSGWFITPEEIAWRNTNRTSAMVQDIPGVRVSSVQGDPLAKIILGRGGCIMNVYIDGQRIHTPSQSSPMSGRRGGDPGMPLNIDALVPISQVRAIEVYPNSSQVPSKYASLGNPCGAVLIWTKVD